MKEFLKRKQGGGNGGYRSLSSSTDSPDKAVSRGATFGAGRGRNRLYDLDNPQEKEDSPDVVTCMI